MPPGHELFVALFSEYGAVKGFEKPTLPSECEGVLVFRATRVGGEITAFDTLLVPRLDGVLCCPVVRRGEDRNPELLRRVAQDHLDVSIAEYMRKQRLASTEPMPPFPRRFVTDVNYSGEGEWVWLAELPLAVEPSHRRLINWVHLERLRFLIHLSF